MLGDTMEVEFDDPYLDRLETDPQFTAGLAPSTVKGFRKAMQHIRAANDERDLYVSKGFHFEKLQGRGTERSMRLNKQYRLILEIAAGKDGRRARVKGIEDYH